MPRQARVVIPGTAYHVTQRGINREKVFFRHIDYGIYLKLLQEHQQDAGVRVWAYCLMPNHVHLVVVPEFEDSLAVLFRRVHGRFAQYVNVREERCGHLWQARFYSCPMSREHLRCALQYVEWNPVRAGLADAAEHYPYSSAGEHLRGPGEASWMDWEVWEVMGGAEGWRGLIENPMDPRMEKRLRRCTYGGAPFGEEEFQQLVEAKTGRVWRRPREN